jgi:hypothetical protein
MPSLTLVNIQDPGPSPIHVRTARHIAVEPPIEDENDDEYEDELLLC